MNGNEVRAARFVRCDRGFGWDYTTAKWDTWFYRDLGDAGWGYAAAEVDHLLRDVAAELDAGRFAGSLIEQATFRRKLSAARYDIDAVDWFLGQLLLSSGRAEVAGAGTDPWRDLPVAQFTRRTSEKYPFDWSFEKVWRDFGQLPGTRLWWGKAARGLTELRTAEQRTIATREQRSGSTTVQAGSRSFTYIQTRVPNRSGADSWPPGIAEVAARSWRDCAGHFAAETMSSKQHLEEARKLRELADDAETPILYSHGSNFNRRAYACITFPDQRWLRFLVRGIKRKHGIMTAVDQAGKKVARYRITDKRRGFGATLAEWPKSVEITVHPEQKLTDELVLAIVESAQWLDSYFSAAGHGG